MGIRGARAGAGHAEDGWGCGAIPTKACRSRFRHRDHANVHDLSRRCSSAGSCPGACALSRLASLRPRRSDPFARDGFGLIRHERAASAEWTADCFLHQLRTARRRGRRGCAFGTGLRQRPVRGGRGPRDPSTAAAPARIGEAASARQNVGSVWSSSPGDRTARGGNDADVANPAAAGDHARHATPLHAHRALDRQARDALLLNPAR